MPSTYKKINDAHDFTFMIWLLERRCVMCRMKMKEDFPSKSLYLHHRLLPEDGRYDKVALIRTEIGFC